MQASKRTRLWYTIALAASLTCGCAAQGGPQTLAEGEQSHFTAAGIDEGNGGIRVTTYQSPQTGQVRLLQEPSYRSQTFTSLQDAAWPWERKSAPDFIVIGEAWVNRHGFSAAWANQLHRIGIKRGQTMQVAVVEGTAEQYLSEQEAASLGYRTVRQSGLADYKAWSVDGRISHDADLVLPYLVQSSGSGKVSVQALLFKKQQPAGRLSPAGTQLLACLQGARELPQLTLETKAATLESVSCRSTVSSNGDLQSPKLRIRLTVASANGGSSAQAIRQEAMTLISWLRDKQVDPLRLGESMRGQQRGYWSDERWREAYKHAVIEVDVATTNLGGAGK